MIFHHSAFLLNSRELFVFGNVDALSQQSNCSCCFDQPFVCMCVLTCEFCALMHQQAWIAILSKSKQKKQRKGKKNDWKKATENNVSGFTGSATHSRFFFDVVVLLFSFFSVYLCRHSFPFHPFSSR